MNNLEKLLKKPTYFILGAGSSRAYQFPLLTDLYIEIIRKNIGVNDQQILQILSRTNVITLNYDRCFEYHFHRKLYSHLCYAEFSDVDFMMTHKKQLDNFFMTHHPHGCIGAGELEPIEGGVIERVQCISKVKSGGYQSNVGAFVPYGNINPNVNLDLVGDDPLDENYKEINENIEPDSNCVVMGFSEIGLQGCRMKWNKFSEIFYFGSDEFSFGENYTNKYDAESPDKADMQLIKFLSASI